MGRYYWWLVGAVWLVCVLIVLVGHWLDRRRWRRLRREHDARRAGLLRSVGPIEAVEPGEYPNGSPNEYDARIGGGGGNSL